MSSIKQWKPQGDSEYPILSSRHTATTVRLKDQETLIIAGLLDSATQTTVRRIPFLSAIPILGKLFQSRSTETIQTEMVVFITPRLIPEV